MSRLAVTGPGPKLIDALAYLLVVAQACRHPWDVRVLRHAAADVPCSGCVIVASGDLTVCDADNPAVFGLEAGGGVDLGGVGCQLTDRQLRAVFDAAVTRPGGHNSGETRGLTPLVSDSAAIFGHNPGETRGLTPLLSRCPRCNRCGRVRRAKPGRRSVRLVRHRPRSSHVGTSPTRHRVVRRRQLSARQQAERQG